ncbi:membrane protein insertase YidC [Cellulomonas sp. URHB0016]
MPVIHLLSALTFPVRWLVASLLVGLHDLVTALGLEPASGAAWASAIVGLVVVVRAVLVPLAVRQVRAAHAMSALQPELRRIRHRHRTDPAAARREQQDAMRSAGVNPVAGCLPALLQAPVLYALYATLSGLGRRSTIGPLGAASVAQAGAATIFGAPLGVAVSAGGAGSMAGGTLFVVLMCVAQLCAAWLAARNRPPVGDDVPFAQQTRWLPYLAPLGMAVAAVHLPVGVLLYWATSAVWSAGQQLVVNRALPYPTLAAP